MHLGWALSVASKRAAAYELLSESRDVGKEVFPDREWNVEVLNENTNWSDFPPWTDDVLYTRFVESDTDDLIRDVTRRIHLREDLDGVEDEEEDDIDADSRSSRSATSPAPSAGHQDTRFVFNIPASYENIGDSHEGYTPPNHSTPIPHGVSSQRPVTNAEQEQLCVTRSPRMARSNMRAPKSHAPTARRILIASEVAMIEDRALKRAEEAAARSAREREEREIEAEVRARDKEHLSQERRIRQHDAALEKERVKQKKEQERKERERWQRQKKEEREAKQEAERGAKVHRRRKAQERKEKARRLAEDKVREKERIREEKERVREEKERIREAKELAAALNASKRAKRPTPQNMHPAATKSTGRTGALNSERPKAKPRRRLKPKAPVSTLPATACQTHVTDRVRADNADNADNAVGIAARTEGGTEERENETARKLTHNDLQQELRKYRSSFSLPGCYLVDHVANPHRGCRSRPSR